MTGQEIIHRAMDDRDFAAAVHDDPGEALAEYDLPEGVIVAFESGDEMEIRRALDADYDAGVPNQ